MPRILTIFQVYKEKLGCGRADYYEVHRRDPDFPKPLYPKPRRPVFAEPHIDRYVEILFERARREADEEAKRVEEANRAKADTASKRSSRKRKNDPNGSDGRVGQ